MSTIKSNDDLRTMWNSVLVRQIAELNCLYKENTYGII